VHRQSVHSIPNIHDLTRLHMVWRSIELGKYLLQSLGEWRRNVQQWVLPSRMFGKGIQFHVPNRKVRAIQQLHDWGM
jgi:hypothetical protein